ncbi:capsid protein [Porcine associated gemykibivirus 1]|nr:capsid protein [Porcine associated gemykibivirus 1]
MAVASRRKTRAAARTTRKPYRRSSRRSYPKRKYPSRRRTMSRKKVLNMTSRKKRDQMMTSSNCNAIGAESPLIGNYALAAPVLVGDSPVYTFPWIATARPRYNGVTADNVRTAATCYMRGLKERIRIQTNSSLTWQWRRICFTFKGDTLITASPVRSFYDTQNYANVGPVRNFNLISSGGRTRVDNHIFHGTFNRDYRTYMDAKLDTGRINVKYDKTRTIASGNERGVWRTYSLWHPMNANLVYDDDESGDGEVSSQLSTESKAGMGDYYIIDFIEPGLVGASTDRLIIDAVSTLYWHEK